MTLSSEHARRDDGWRDRWTRQARWLKRMVHALVAAWRDPRTPWLARIVAAVVIGYAFSPIDLIPDFIPFLGYLDDLVLIPLGVALAIRLIPAPVWADAQAEALRAQDGGQRLGRVAGVIIIALWLGIAVVGILLARQWL